MGVNHSGTHIAEAEEFLNRADVVPVLKQMGCKGMAERVRSCWLCHSGFLNGLFHRFLHYGFVKMAPASFTRHPVGLVTGCGKYPLPSPLFSGVGVFALQGVRQCDPPQAAFEIAPVLLLDYFEMLSERFFQRCRKHRVPIFVSFAGTHNYLVGGEIDIFDPQLQTLHQSQARSVEKHQHQPIGVIEDTENRLYFLSCQNHR